MIVTQVSSCCGLDLKTGGLIIGCSGILFHLTNLMLAFGYESIGVWVNLYFVFVHISWVYGIAKKDPNYLKLGLIFPVILSMYSFGSVFSATINLSYFIFMSYYHSQWDDRDINIMGLLFAVYFIIFLFIVIDVYITLVKYSLYKGLIESEKEHGHSLDITFIQMETKQLAKGETTPVKTIEMPHELNI